MRRVLLVACAVVAASCGQTGVSPSGVTGAPSTPLPLEGTCSTDAPGSFVVEPRNGNAYLSWSASASAHAYEVEIYEVSSGELVAANTLSDTRWEWGAPGLGQGPYRARVRAIRECGTGRWSADDVFILNRNGSSGPPPSTPAPPVPVPPAAPLLACGTLQGHHVVNLLGTTFLKGMAPVFAPLALPAGKYRVDIETNDPGHLAGHQTAQTEEVVTVWGVGTTQDIPEAAVRQVTTFTATLPLLAQVVVEAGPHSVHGVCVAFTRM